ncbi:MAG: acyl-CoA dehydrogenase family protein [Polyangiales bacterium]
MTSLHTLCEQLAATAIERDREGGLPKRERDLIRASGLLKLTVPTRFGGDGQPISAMLDAVRTIARVDPALAHVFAFHHLMLYSVRLYASEQQWSVVYREAADGRTFWGNALNPKDPRTQLRKHGDGYLLDGSKSFCSGAGDSDRLIVSAQYDGKLVVAMVPTRRAGITVRGDWDAIGQRQTDSGTVDFSALAIHEHELLRTPGPLGSVFAGLRSCIAQAILVHVYLGIAEGAFAELRHVKGPSTIQRLRAGELYVALEAAAALAERARASLDASWTREEALTPEERARASVAITLAKVATTRAGLDVTTRFFELLGARSALRPASLDRYFRNLRTHTLHDPVDEKLTELGAFALEGTAPTPGFYS